MENPSVSVEVERVEQDKNLVVVHIRPHEGVKKQEIYLLNNTQWEALSSRFVPGQKVSVTLVDVKGNLLAAVVEGEETCSKKYTANIQFHSH